MDQEKKRICIIYTGGTIGMVTSQNGYVPKEGMFRELLRSIHDMHRPEFPDWELVEFSPLLDSSNISVGEWNKIGRVIAQRYDEFDGFVVLHGTDTMAYTASALSFMLENLNKPVVLTGSQIPLCMLRSDGMDNIVNAILVAASDRVFEVCLYFGGKLLRGNRSTKKSADLLEAFESPNAPHLAETGIDIQYNDAVIRPRGTGKLHLQEFMDVPIGVLKVFPGIQFELFESIMTDKLKGVVFEAFGAGNIPSGPNSDLLPIVERAYRNGTIITVCSQCLQGSVSLGTYETSRGLAAADAVSGGDMTIEAAVAKLYYLFSCGYSKEEIRTKMEQNLRGERS
jgi:L-asparaginase